MSGVVGIHGRTFPEWRAWAIAGFLGVLTPVAGLSLLMWVFVPVIGAALLAGLAYVTWRLRAGVRARTVRVWAAAGWALLVGLVPMLLIHATPAGTSWPPVTLPDVAYWITSLTSVTVVPAVIAAGAYEVGRRRLWTGES